MGTCRIPGAICESKEQYDLADGTMCRQQSSQPGPTLLALTNSRVADWSESEKLIAAAKMATPYLPAEMREQFSALFTPMAIGTTTVLLAAWGASHFFGVGEIADAVLLVVGVAVLGWQAIGVAADLWAYFSGCYRAKTMDDLDQAARRLAHAVGIIGVTAFVAILTKGAVKAVKAARSGRTQGSNAWWEADNFGPNFPGTNIPKGFTLKVGNQTFHIKPNATKHMADHAASNSSVGAYASQTEFPISSLAGALENAAAEGKLAPLLEQKISRLGTPSAPFRIQDWELSIELIAGRLEVFHAVYKP